MLHDLLIRLSLGSHPVRPVLAHHDAMSVTLRVDNNFTSPTFHRKIRGVQVQFFPNLPAGKNLPPILIFQPDPRRPLQNLPDCLSGVFTKPPFHLGGGKRFVPKFRRRGIPRTFHTNKIRSSFALPRPRFPSFRCSSKTSHLSGHPHR